MSRGARLRSRLFDQGAKAAHHVLGCGPSVYVCPLCLRLHGHHDLKTKRLTLEDVPPKSQGGRPIALTCRRCNNEAGSTVDRAVADRERVIDWVGMMAGKPGSSRVRLDLDGVSVDATMEVTPERTYLHVSEANDPQVIQEFGDSAGALTDGSTIGVTKREGYWPRKAAVGDLKSAYLAAFAALGYAYILGPGMGLVRHQIARPEEELIGTWWINDKPLGRANPVLGVTEKPVAGVFAGLRRSSVYLPFGQSADQFYEEFGRIRQTLQKQRIPGLQLPWPRQLEMRLDYSQEAWEVLRSLDGESAPEL